MFIKFLSVENWKCFKNETKFYFKSHELISLPNGSGKTSIFEAIIYLIWDKKPLGFNLNDVRYDAYSPCTLYIEFEQNGSLFSILKSFGNQKSSDNRIELKIDGKLTYESNNEIKRFINSMFDANIVNELWTSSLISSEILNVNYLRDTILSDAFNEPNRILISCKRELNSLKKEANSIENELKNPLDLKSIKASLSKTESKIKNLQRGDSINESYFNLAKNAKNASEKLESIKSTETYRNFQAEDDSVKCLYTESDTIKWERLALERDSLESDLKSEMEKIESVYSEFDPNTLLKIVNVSRKLNICVMCGTPLLTETTLERYLNDEMYKNTRNSEKIDKIREKLNFLNSLNKDYVNLFKLMKKCEETIALCPNYIDIIKKYDTNLNALWSEYDSLNRQLAEAERQKSLSDRLSSLNDSINAVMEKIDFLKTYLTEANAFYSDSILKRASNYISSINPRYQDLSIYENSFAITLNECNNDFGNKMSSGGLLTILSVSKLSKGEKTIVALSILFAIHDTLTPDLPFLFDETFANLDHQNLETVKEFLRKQDNQIFVITHDTTWSEF